MKLLEQLLEAADATEVRALLKQFGVQSQKFADIIVHNVSPAQVAALTKCLKFKWKLSKVLYPRDGRKMCAIAMYADGTAAWMKPDGSIERAPVGKKTAYLKDKDWLEQDI